MQFPLPIASYRLPAPAAASSRLVNCFAEAAPPSSTKGQPAMLRRAPGIRAWVEVGDGPIRGMTVMGSLLYVLSGDTLYSVNSAGTTTALDGTVPGSERVRISNNGFDIVIVRPTGGAGYQCDGTTVTEILDSTYVGWLAGDVDFIDGYFVFRRPGSQQFFNSGLNAVTFNALDIKSAEGAPDELNGMIVDHREIFLTGTTTCELFYNAANPAGSPFSRTPNGLLEIGSAASYSLLKQDNGVFWLASDRTFRRLNGPTPVRVSQHGIESIVQRMSVVSDCFGLSYSQEGHLFCAFTFPMEGRTLVLDATTGEWHERESLGYNRWRANALIMFGGMQLVGDSESGKVGILDPDTHEEWGEPQRVEITYQSVYGDNHRASHHRFELVVNSGYGVTVGQGADPLATLKVSDDGGTTFRALPTRSLGLRGQYKARAQWHRLGSSRDRVYRVEITDPIPLFVIDTQIDVTGARL